jgi:serine/threonine protein phosphatase PrpC
MYEISNNIENKFMVIGSDGLWEFISQEQVLEIVIPSFVRNDAQSAVKDLEHAAVQAWKK